MHTPVLVKAGQKYTRWTVLERSENTNSGAPRFLCQCDCGTFSVLAGNALRRGNTKSCGCFARDHAHDPKRHGYHGTRTYASWVSMRSRCTNPLDSSYARYGGAGITFCERWNSFEWFIEDMGERPADKSLDRWPNQLGNYEPGNCRWATRSEQGNNKKSNRLIEIDGNVKTLAEWARHTGINYNTLQQRFNLGWPPHQCITPLPARP